MPIEVTMAKLSPTMESGQMVKWLVKVGDRVKEGDTLAEVQTDKAVMPMEAFDEGIVARLDVNEGDDIALGQRVLVLARKGEDPKAVADQFAKGGGPPAGTTASVAVSKDYDSQEATNTPNRPDQPAPSSQPARPTPAAPTGGNGREGAAPSSGRVKASPLARKIAATAGIEISEVPGSGPAGRIIRRDVDTFLQARPAARPSPASRPAANREPRRIPHSPMRKTIAKRMLQSKQSAPEIHVTVDVRVDKVAAIREALNQQLAAEKVKLSMGDFVTKAVALALRRHPALNASFEPDAIVEHAAINLGIAVALDGGLIVPVLRDADTLGLRAIRTGSEALAQAARANKLTSEQLTGGTFTISNLGMYGVRAFDAIINLPEVAILAVGAAEKRPVVERDTLVIGNVLTLTLTADHRAVDGATAAEFLRTLKGLLEEPASMLL